MYECILERYAELYSMPWVKNARINEGEDNHPVLQHFIATAQSLLRVLGHIRSFILANDAAQRIFNALDSDEALFAPPRQWADESATLQIFHAHRAVRQAQVPATTGVRLRDVGKHLDRRPVWQEAATGGIRRRPELPCPSDYIPCVNIE